MSVKLKFIIKKTTPVVVYSLVIQDSDKDNKVLDEAHRPPILYYKSGRSLLSKRGYSKRLIHYRVFENF